MRHFLTNAVQRYIQIQNCVHVKIRGRYRSKFWVSIEVADVPCHSLSMCQTPFQQHFRKICLLKQEDNFITFMIDLNNTTSGGLLHSIYFQAPVLHWSCQATHKVSNARLMM